MKCNKCFHSNWDFLHQKQTHLMAWLTCKSCFAASAPARVENVTNPTGCQRIKLTYCHINLKQNSLKLGRTSMQLYESMFFVTHRRSFPIFACHFQKRSFVALIKDKRDKKDKKSESINFSIISPILIETQS